MVVDAENIAADQTMPPSPKPTCSVYQMGSINGVGLPWGSGNLEGQTKLIMALGKPPRFSRKIQVDWLHHRLRSLLNFFANTSTVIMDSDRQALKQKLFTLIRPLQTAKRGSPLTNRTLPVETCQNIEQLVTAIEAVNPYLSPLLYTPQLLNGAWLLNYSTAREIRSLDKLPLGLKVGRIYQIIDVASQSFLNQAFVRHPLGLAAGYVKVTARFDIAKPEGALLPDKRINVEFLERTIAVQRLLGIKTPNLDPAKVVAAKGPEGRVPFLEITYIDDDLRIGRGGEGSLFVLSRADQVIP